MFLEELKVKAKKKRKLLKNDRTMWGSSVGRRGSVLLNHVDSMYHFASQEDPSWKTDVNHAISQPIYKDMYNAVLLPMHDKLSKLLADAQIKGTDTEIGRLKEGLRDVGEKIQRHKDFESISKLKKEDMLNFMSFIGAGRDGSFPDLERFTREHKFSSAKPGNDIASYIVNQRGYTYTDVYQFLSPSTAATPARKPTKSTYKPKSNHRTPKPSSEEPGPTAASGSPESESSSVVNPPGMDELD